MEDYSTGGGWLKMFYQFLDWEWYHDNNMVRMFLHLLLKANYKTKRWQGIEIPRGSLVTSRQKLAEQTNLSEREVRTCLKRLQTTNEIGIKTTNKYTIITICNYEKYQAEEIDAELTKDTLKDQQTTSRRPTKAQRKTTTKERKNINTFSNEKGSEPEGSLSLEEVKKPSDEKKIEKSKPPTLITRARQVFEDLYLQQYEDVYYWSAKDGANMKQLLHKISHSRQNRPIPLKVDDDSLIEALGQFLTKINKGWIADNFTVSIINSQYNSIISELKNKKTTQNGRPDPNRQFIDPRDGRPITFEEHIALKVQSSKPGEDATGSGGIPEEVW